MQVAVPNSVNLKKVGFESNGILMNSISDALEDSGLMMAGDWIDYEESPELTKIYRDNGLELYLDTQEESLKESFKGEDDKMKLKINELIEENTVKNGDFYVGWAKVDIDKFHDYMTSHPELKIYKRGSDYYVATSEHDSYAQQVDNSIIDTLKSDPRFKKLFVESKSIKEESLEESAEDLNRYEFLVKRYDREADREAVTAISLEDAEDQLNSDTHVEYWDYLPDFNYKNESLNEATDDQYLYCQASIEDDIRDYLTDDELSEISSYIGSDGTIINCEFGRCDIQFSDEFIVHQIPVEYLNIEMNESLNEDALDDHGVSRANVNLLAERIPNGRFYFNRNRYVLGKELPDYFDDNEVIVYSDYQNSDGVRIPNAYKILKRFTEDFSSITALADDCGKNTFKTSKRDIRFTFNDEKSAIKFMDELRDKNIYFDELSKGVIKVNKSVALDEIYKGEDGKIKLKINEDSHNETFTEKDFNDYVKHTKDDVRHIALSVSRMMQEHDEYHELFENLIDELVDILKNDSGMFQTESLKLKESTNSLDNYKVLEFGNHYDYPKYSKTLYLPSIRQGKVKLTIGTFSDPRYDDDHMFEILVVVDVESRRTDFTLDSEKLYSKLNIRDGHEKLSGYDDSYDDLEGIVDEIYDYFMTLDQDDIDDTLIELSDDFDANRVKQMFGPMSTKLRESTDSLNDYKVYKILINALVPNSINLARHLSPNGECYNEIVDVLRKNGLNLADAIIDYKENPELTKRLHDMGIVHGNSTIEELTDKVLKKLDDNGYDTSDKDVRNYAEAAAELIINDVNQDIDDWYSETLINYPEDLEELPKK